MISIRAVEDAISQILTLPTHTSGETPSLPSLCRTWGWRGKNRKLNRNQTIHTIMKSAMYFHENRQGAFNLLVQEPFEREPSVAELHSNISLLQSQLDAECQIGTELQRELANTNEQAIQLQSQCQSLSDLVASQTRQIADSDQALKSGEHDRIQLEAELQTCTSELEAARQKKKPVRFTASSGRFTRSKRYKQPPPTPGQTDRKEKAARLLTLVERDVLTLPFHSTGEGPGRLHLAKYIALHGVASGHQVNDSAKLASDVTNVSVRKIKEYLLDEEKFAAQWTPIEREWDVEDEFVMFSSVHSGRGKNSQHKSLFDDEVVRNRAIQWLRENSIVTGRPNLTVRGFMQWVNATLVPSLVPNEDGLEEEMKDEERTNKEIQGHISPHSWIQILSA